MSIIGPEISKIVSKTLGHPTDKYTINSFNLDHPKLYQHDTQVGA